MSDLNFVIEGRSESKTRLNVKARNFNFVIDEPVAFGGQDLGANPVEYLLASYAGCVNVMAYLIADELNFRLDNLSIRVDGNINPARLFGKSLDDRAGFKQINLELKPETNASPEVLKKWINEIKNRCPINDNLQNPTPVNLHVEILMPTLVETLKN